MTTTTQQRSRKPRVRANGEGSVFRLPDGRWRATRTAYVSKVGDGKRKQKLVTGSGATREIAIQRRDEAWKKWLVASGQAPQDILRESTETRVTTVEEWFYEWHRNLDKSRTRELYRRQILSRIELHIVPAMGKTALRLVTPDVVEQFITTLTAKRKADGTALLSESSVHNVFRTFSLGMDAAVKKGHIAMNPCERVQAPKKSRVRTDIDRHKWVPLHLLQRLEGKPEEAFYLIRMVYGVRISELLGLTDDSLFLSSRNPRIVIKQQLLRRDVQHGCGRRSADGSFPCGKKTAGTCPKRVGTPGWYLGDPKTKAGERTLPLVEPVLSALKEHMTRQKSLRESEGFSPLPGLENLVFTNSNGGPIRPTQANDEWHALLKEHGVDYIRGHALRNMTATLMVEMGVPLEVAKVVLGHSDVLMTAYYAQVGTKATEQPLKELATYITKRQKRAKNKK